MVVPLEGLKDREENIMKTQKAFGGRSARILAVAGCVLAINGVATQAWADDWREVNENVRDQIAMLQPQIGSHTIEIDNNGRGRIALEGYVESEEARRRVQQAAEKAEGVTSVENRLSVSTKEQPPRDSEVAQLQEAFRREVPYGRYNIAVNTHPDKVVLHGTVDSIETKRKIVEVASSVSKRTVQDELAVAPIKTDAEIEGAIRRALTKEYPNLMKGLEVNVKDGVAMVSGTASSHVDVDKVLAAILNIEGVRDINSQVTVRGRKHAPREQESSAAE